MPDLLLEVLRSANNKPQQAQTTFESLQLPFWLRPTLIKTLSSVHIQGMACSALIEPSTQVLVLTESNWLAAATG